jgi:ferredoxin-NADP reductase/predicted pyridoxine 5'-phosphate oxidase superfamily flavin-nucleotide-binding protein/ferredoxin
MQALGWPGSESPFHEGERAIQRRLGAAEKMDRQGRSSIRSVMPDQHRQFFAQLPFVLAAAVDGSGQPWASILVGQPGFATSPDPSRLRLHARPLLGDPFAGTLAEGGDIGLLGIELPTRRRNRLNGVVSELSGDGFTVQVRQSFGNCPQYIQTRVAHFIRDPALPVETPVVRSARLDDAALKIVTGADTVFIASANEDPQAKAGKGVDISHRGGRPGFVRVDDDHTLTVPDFVGNFHFNTIGNLTLDPRAGLLFIDFDSGDLLSLTATAAIQWDGPEVQAFAGAERLIRFHITKVVRLPGALPLRFSEPGVSPFLSRTGAWDEVARNLEAERLRQHWRPFAVTRTMVESEAVVSLILEPADGGGVAPYRAGQYLPIRLPLAGASAPALRTYTISDAPNGKHYRLSIKREGAGSSWLHAAPVGTIIEALAPRGDFFFDEGSKRPAVMISAGIGITPMIAMLNSLLVNDGRTRSHSTLWFIHGARDGRHHAFAADLHRMKQQYANLRTHIRFSAPEPDDQIGETYDSEGRIDRGLLTQLLPLDDYEFYLCGPPGFMQSVYDVLRSVNVPDGRIHLESFGPASVRRDRPLPAPPLHAASEEAVEVRFARSGIIALWTPAAGSLLDLAEAQGLAPAFSCRSGLCGTCVTPIISGAVHYTDPPEAAVAPGEVLICCAVPRAGPHLDEGSDRSGVTLDL